MRDRRPQNRRAPFGDAIFRPAAHYHWIAPNKDRPALGANWNVRES